MEVELHADKPKNEVVKVGGGFRSSLFILVTAILINYVTERPQGPELRIRLGGTVEPGFEAVKDAFRLHVESGFEPGAAFAVYYRGVKVVDLWGGYADTEAGRAWDATTVAQLWSSTKAVTALVVAAFVDAGIIDYDDTVAQHWPEFGKKGKETITIGQLMSHQAGLSYLDVIYEHRRIWRDPGTLSLILEKQKPLWQIGRGFGYHGSTYGLLVDQLLRRVDPDQRSLSRLVRDIFAEPLGLNLTIGLAREKQHAVARPSSQCMGFFDFLALPWETKMTYMMQASGLFTDIASDANVDNPVDLRAALTYPVVASHPDWLETECGSYFGFATAESLARLFGVLANEGRFNDSDGTEQTLMNAPSIRRLATPAVSGKDRVLGVNVTFGQGMWLEKQRRGRKSYKIFGHPGEGGQMVYADPQRNLGFAYLTNHHSLASGFSNARFSRLHEALIEAIDAKLKQ